MKPRPQMAVGMLGANARCGCAAQACQEARNDDADIADFIDIDAESIRRPGCSPSAQVHAPAGPVKYDHHADGKDQRDQGGHADIEVVCAAGEPAAEQLGIL